MARRWSVLLAVGLVLVHGAAACVGGGDDGLNPQPLPPEDPDKAETPEGRGSSSGSSGGSTTAPGSQDSAPDGGTDGPIGET